ncbi:terpene synthase [Actinomadura sp. KC345]|uniref:terpene synthase family protein n=1 Tax=Actinomadura sp. KC345 TaxID=2530371 RepID=UPI00104A8BA5|nr:terpene synthase [Actinomadura sp. KC345]TDC50758.1 terpene synthase [Actinomadura sp. KC345]
MQNPDASNTGDLGAGGPLRAAQGHGTVLAQAVRAARDLAACAEAYPDLFAAKPIDGTLFTAVACANAFGSPKLSASQLRIANRTSLWIFGLDWLVDHVATTREEIDDLNRRCLDVADGREPSPGDDLARFLADIRDEVAASPAFAALRGDWRSQLVRLLESGAREVEWKASASSGDRDALPSFEVYLDNADNYGSAWVNISHWIVNGDAATLAHVDRLQVVSREVQKILRLLNDLATLERDKVWGDLNAQMLGADAGALTARIEEIVGHCRAMLEPLRGECPEAVDYLERQIGYSTGFYGTSDYWGSL